MVLYYMHMYREIYIYDKSLLMDSWPSLYGKKNRELLPVSGGLFFMRDRAQFSLQTLQLCRWWRLCAREIVPSGKIPKDKTFKDIHMILNHVNIGYPMVTTGCTIVADIHAEIESCWTNSWWFGPVGLKHMFNHQSNQHIWHILTFFDSAEPWLWKSPRNGGFDGKIIYKW